MTGVQEAVGDNSQGEVNRGGERKCFIKYGEQWHGGVKVKNHRD